MLGLTLAMLFSSAGCSFIGGLTRPPPVIKFAPKMQGEPFQPVAATQVRVYHRGDQLPPGFSMSREGDVEVEKDFPTKADASWVTGEVRLDVDRRLHLSSEEMLQKVVAEAAKHGASAVVVTSCEANSTGCLATSIWVSSAAPNTIVPPASEVLAVVPAEVPPNAARTDLKGNLESVTGLNIPGKRGTCYSLGIALDTGASLCLERSSRRVSDCDLKHHDDSHGVASAGRARFDPEEAPGAADPHVVCGAPQNAGERRGRARDTAPRGPVEVGESFVRDQPQGIFGRAPERARSGEGRSRHDPRGAVKGMESTLAGLDDPGAIGRGEEPIGGLPGSRRPGGLPSAVIKAKQRLPGNSPPDPAAEHDAMDSGRRLYRRPAAPALHEAHLPGATDDLRLRRPEHCHERAARGAEPANLALVLLEPSREPAQVNALWACAAGVRANETNAIVTAVEERELERRTGTHGVRE